MSTTNIVTRTFTLRTTTPEQQRWLNENLVAVVKIRNAWAEQREQNPVAGSLFGLDRKRLANLVPEAERMSGYVNFGMAGLSFDTCNTELQSSFRYRSSNRGAIYQDEAGWVYASGYPGASIQFENPEPLPEDLDISSITFTYDKQFKTWSVTFALKMRRTVRSSKRPKPLHAR
jgi:hypothetical protein